MTELFQQTAAAGAAITLPQQGSIHVDSNQQGWQECGAPGFRIKPLMEDSDAGLRSWLMRVDAGAYSELHAHEDIEQIFVVEGSFYDQDGHYGPGDYIVRAAGALHTAGSDEGAIVVLFYSAASS